MSAFLSNSTMPVPSSITSASRALVSKAPAASGASSERRGRGRRARGLGSMPRTPGRSAGAAAPTRDRAKPPAAVKIYPWLYQAAARGATRLCAPAPASSPMPSASAASLESADPAAPARAGEERDDDLGAGVGVDDQRPLRPRQAGDRGPEPGGAVRRVAHAPAPSRLKASGLGRGPRSCRLQRRRRRRAPSGRPQAASSATASASAP